jgi:WD40 repeat protein
VYGVGLVFLSIEKNA